MATPGTPRDLRRLPIPASFNAQPSLFTPRKDSMVLGRSSYRAVNGASHHSVSRIPVTRCPARPPSLDATDGMPGGLRGRATCWRPDWRCWRLKSSQLAWRSRLNLSVCSWPVRRISSTIGSLRMGIGPKSFGLHRPDFSVVAILPVVNVGFAFQAARFPVRMFLVRKLPLGNLLVCETLIRTTKMCSEAELR